MIRIFTCLLALLVISPNPTVPISNAKSLEHCVSASHCFQIDLNINDADNSFEKVLDIVSSIPRTTIVEQSDFYIHAEATTKWMHFVDDLEIIKIPEKGILQFRSESRVGLGDMGVNKRRVTKLLKLL